MVDVKVAAVQLNVLALLLGSCFSAVILTAGPEPSARSKVQKMIQNSEHSSFCNMGQIRQIITHEHCESREVENQVCAGSCFSYSLPQTDPKTPGDVTMGFCESCQPSVSSWINVTLPCTKDEDSYQVTIGVQQITNCTCSACSKIQFEENAVEEEEQDKGRISGMLSSVLPQPSDEDYKKEMTSKMAVSPLSILSSQPNSKAGVPADNRDSSKDSSDQPPEEGGVGPSDTADLKGPPYKEFPGPYVLEEEDVIFNPEGESDPNLLSSVMGSKSSDSELTDLMKNLNMILQGDGPVNYQGLSIGELRAVINNLNEKKKKSSPNEAVGEDVLEAEEKLE